MSCQWTPNCRGHGSKLIIYGCFNYHLYEHYYCPEHYSSWVFAYNTGGWYCLLCDLKIEEFTCSLITPVMLSVQGPVTANYPVYNIP